MITSVHNLIYSDDAPATRAFFRDVMGLPFVEDVGSEDGWLIFGTGPSEFGVHPTSTVWEGRQYDSPRQHLMSFMCDDLDATMADLAAKGATFASGPREQSFGVSAMVEVPGADPIMIYEPRHEVAFHL
jgi:catechol 2,3-dioxygenase-like lactoylglutathione lyase family enzyme